MVVVLVGLLAGLALVVVRGAVRRRAGSVLSAPGADREGLPSRLRDPETGEVL